MTSELALHTHVGSRRPTPSTLSLRAWGMAWGRRIGAILVLGATACTSPDEPAAVSPRIRPTLAPTTTTAPPPPTVPPPATTRSCPQAPPRGEPDPNRPRYKLTVDIRLSENAVVGSTAVRFIPDLAVDKLVFRLWPNGPRPSQGGGSITVGEVTVDGAVVAATVGPEDRSVLSVPLAQTVPAGRAINAQVPWRLQLPASSRDRISREGDAVRLGSFFPILPWEPGTGWQTEPPTGQFAEASTAPVADFDLTVTVPEGLGVLASGVADGPGHWTATAMRDVALSVGRFTLATGTAMAPGPVQVTVGVHQTVNESAERYLNKVLAVMADFGKRYGPYPWPTFTLAITPAVGGGIEYPGHVMQGPGTIGATTSHELAHQWFYGLVGNDQGRDPWLDEGLASWGEARYEATLPEFLANATPSGATGRLGQPMTYWASQPAIYFQGVYVQGVKALAAFNDPDLVDCALRTYVAVFAHRIARPADLVAALSAVFPDARTVLAPFGV